MQKDSAGFIGFVFKDGKIKSLVKDSSAARNGVLTEHQLIEVNGQNVVGVKVREYMSSFIARVVYVFFEHVLHNIHMDFLYRMFFAGFIFWEQILYSRYITVNTLL